MEPLTATAITEAIVARSPEAAEATRGALETSALDGLEITAEAREAIIGENGLTQQIDSIKSESMDALAARNEARLEARRMEGLRETRQRQLDINRDKGKALETAAFNELMREYPAEDGYHIEQQCSLRNKEGKVVHDPKTGESRRVDFAVIKDGEIVRSDEVTSKTANKTGQPEKEARIRDAGGNFIKHRGTKELVPFAPGVKTEIRRRA